jgi:hypothetical protein
MVLKVPIPRTAQPDHIVFYRQHCTYAMRQNGATSQFPGLKRHAMQLGGVVCIRSERMVWWETLSKCYSSIEIAHNNVGKVVDEQILMQFTQFWPNNNVLLDRTRETSSQYPLWASSESLLRSSRYFECVCISGTVPNLFILD